jgi:dTDP-4-amino-4,6-dideoxygalactose transaminase
MVVKVPFYRHDLDSSYAQAVADVLDSQYLTTGAVSRAVESDICEFFGVPHAVLVNSWTNGAVATLLALGIGPGDEIIVPAMTFIASANVAELVGAKPVFVDVDPDTLVLTPAKAAAALTPRTRAIVPVHLYGQMCDVRALRTVIADRPEIAIIEDAAHSFESSYDGDLPGAHSDAAIFSFYATKNISCGEGGAIITRRPDLFQAVLQTRLHGMSAGAVDRFAKDRYQHWDMARLGTKANLPDLLAALLPRQIATVRERLKRRDDIARRYEKAFAGNAIRLAEVLPGAVSARHLFPIHVPPRIRDRALQALNEQGIGTTVNYRSVPTLTYYRQKYGYTADDFPVSFEWGEGTITLPLFPSLTAEEQDYVIANVLDVVVPMIQA